MIITINTDRKYNILLEEGIINTIGSKLAETHSPCKVCVISDTNSEKYWGAPLKNSLEGFGFNVHTMVFPPGEQSKSFACLEKITEYLAINQFTRYDFLIGLGGGVIGDLTGFAASVYMRGMDFYNVPTTLLSAVDSSVGGKTAINLPTGKNMVGTFWQPRGVFFDINTLKTLPPSQMKNGLGEVIKAGVIMDETIISLLENSWPTRLPEILPELIFRSIRVKKEIVELDEREKGLRQTLNLGHTAGHAIEKLSDFKIPHGQAVSMGLMTMAKISERLGWADENMSYRLLHLYQRYDIKVQCPYLAADVAREITADKKRRGDHITLAVPLKIGHCTLRNLPMAEISQLLLKGMEY